MTSSSIARRVLVRQPGLALTLITTLASSLVAPSAYAQTQTPAENVAAARALGTQGIKLADAGDCPGAIEKLSRAEALYHAPSILGRLGECQVKVGQIVLGTENLNRVVREELAATAPKAFRDAQERAKGVLASALPKIAHLTIRVDPADAKPEVTVGGIVLPDALIGAERPTDPGTHEVVVKAPGYREYRASVTLAEGGSQDVAVRLEKDPSLAPPPPPPPPPPVVTTGPATMPPTDAPAAKSNTLAYVALGVGGVGLAVGGVTGFLALSKKGDLKNCEDSRCPSSQQDTLDGAKSMATVSTVGFTVGFVGVGLGVVLLLTGGGSAKAEARAQKPLESASLGGVRVTPWISGQSAGVSGSF